MEKRAILSDDRVYRYALWRTWDSSKATVLFVGLNPSTADERNDDHTLRRCMGFARSWGYGGVCLVNLFAFRSPFPAVMMRAADPVGPENDKWIRQCVRCAAMTVCAWGNGGAYLGRGNQVKGMLKDPLCLALNASGQPTHPRFLKASLMPQPFA